MDKGENGEDESEKCPEIELGKKERVSLIEREQVGEKFQYEG